jgi:LDH2 family malate/lactate/ureidoglycolate dehydrogenase
MDTSQIFMVIKPDFFVPRVELDRIMEEYVKVFRATPVKKGVERVLLPGELEHGKEQDRRKNGIPVSDALIKELNEYADTIGIPRIA